MLPQSHLAQHFYLILCKGRVQNYFLLLLLLLCQTLQVIESKTGQTYDV